MRDGELDYLYHRWSGIAWERGLLKEFETRYRYYRQRCWSKRECILVAATELNLPGWP
jgi:hypothetical protein